MKLKQYLLGGNSKSIINPLDFDDPIGWDVLNGDGEKQGVDLLAQRVPWFYRGIKDRANNTSSMPWSIEYNDVEVTNNSEWASVKVGLYTTPGQKARSEKRYKLALKSMRTWTKSQPRELAFIENPRKLFSQIEQSLIMAGKAYLALEVNPSGYIKNIRYLHPGTISEVYDRTDGHLTGYKRSVNGKTFDASLATEEPVNGQVQIVGIYDPDYSVEIGPGKMSDALAAMTAAGVLFNYDEFVARYFRSGAIKTQILTVEKADENERKRLTKWWNDVVSGVSRAFSSLVFMGKGVEPIVIGEGMEALKDNDLSTLRRQDISTAIGIPESRLWSAAANMATRKEDESAYFRGTIIPECDLIAEALNQQVFTDIHHLKGYRIEFQPESLDVFQEDEANRAGALGQLTGAGVPLLMAMDILGYDLSDEQRKELEEMDAEDEPGPVPPQLAPFAGQDNPPAVAIEEPAIPEPAPMNAIDQAASIRAMLKNWQKKALHVFKMTQRADVPWETDLLSSVQLEDIREQLRVCETAEKIKGVFDGVKVEPIEAKAIDPIMELVHELRLAREAIGA